MKAKEDCYLRFKIEKMNGKKNSKEFQLKSWAQMKRQLVSQKIS